MIIDGEEVFIINEDVDQMSTLVYAPLRSYLAQIPREVSVVLTSSETSHLRETFVQTLRQRPRLNMRETLRRIQNSTPELTLAITDNCNLRCVYCHASAGEPHKRQTMSRDMIDIVLQNYFDYVGDAEHIIINFHGGGEPTFALPELKYAIQRARALASRNEPELHFTMSTNGYYGDKLRRFVIENFTSVSLSLDGPALIQDKHRPRANGSGSFHRVFETAKFFYRHDFSFGIRATVSSFSIDYLSQIIDFVAAEFPGQSIAFEHLSPFGRALTCKDRSVASPNREQFTSHLIAALEYAKGKLVHVDNAASTKYDNLKPVFCTSVGIPNWTVLPNGDIVACAREDMPPDFLIGNVDTPSRMVKLDKSKIGRVRKMNVFNYPECSDCFCKYHCVGDCPDRRLADKSDCASIRRIGRKVLKSKLAKSNSTCEITMN